jgi:uncharacterized protein (DUF924 family)
LKFNSYLEEALKGSLHDWCYCGIKSVLSLIIICDQFSRHIFRYLNVSKDDAIRKKADSMALSYSEFLINRRNWENQLSSTELIFVLMPLRHNPSITRLNYIMKTIETKDNHEKESFELLNKFRKQTLTRLQRMQDRAKVSYIVYNHLYARLCFMYVHFTGRRK